MGSQGGGGVVAPFHYEGWGGAVAGGELGGSRFGWSVGAAWHCRRRKKTS
jgi:hypothetical protein